MHIDMEDVTWIEPILEEISDLTGWSHSYKRLTALEFFWFYFLDSETVSVADKVCQPQMARNRQSQRPAPRNVQCFSSGKKAGIVGACHVLAFHPSYI